MPKSLIDEVKEDNKKEKKNSLVKNAKMTPTQAQQAQ